MFKVNKVEQIDLTEFKRALQGQKCEVHREVSNMKRLEIVADGFAIGVAIGAFLFSVLLFDVSVFFEQTREGTLARVILFLCGVVGSLVGIVLHLTKEV